MPDHTTKYIVITRIILILYAALVLWASVRDGGGPALFLHSDKLMHAVFYGLFTLIAGYSVLHRTHFYTLSLTIIMYGGLMEYLQSFNPSRMMSFADMISNSTGVVLVGYFLARNRFRTAQPSVTTGTQQ